MNEIITKTQLSVVRRIAALIDDAKRILGDDASLDVLEGAQAQNLSELQSHLVEASACLRALQKHLSKEGPVRALPALRDGDLPPPHRR